MPVQILPIAAERAGPLSFMVTCHAPPTCRIYGHKSLEMAQDLRFIIAAFGKDDTLVYSGTTIVPEGLWTDGASVPRFLHWWLPPHHREYIQAAVLHDYLYETHASEHLAERIGLQAKHGRWLADQLFLAALKGTKKWRNYALYWAVRLFGRHAWDTDVKPLTGEQNA